MKVLIAFWLAMLAVFGFAVIMFLCIYFVGTIHVNEMKCRKEHPELYDDIPGF